MSVSPPKEPDGGTRRPCTGRRGETPLIAWFGATDSPRRARVLAAGAAVLVVGWIVVILALPALRFVVLAPRAKTGFEVFLATLQLFVALVLALFPEENTRQRLRWAALGFLVLGLGGLGFGYLRPLVEDEDNLSAALYGALLTRLFGSLALSLGLVPVRPRALSHRTVVVFLALFGVLGAAVTRGAGELPTLIKVAGLEEAAADSSAILHGLTVWYWAFDMVPLSLAVLATIGAIRRSPELALGDWLVVAMALMAGAQVHTLFWPSAFSPILTTASLLRLAFTVILTIGTFVGLRRVAVTWEARLAVERESSTRLAEVARLRADFNAIVAHEFASPIAAIRGYAMMLKTGTLDRTGQIEAGTVIRAETDLLNTLVADVRAAASVESVDFALYRFPLAVNLLLADAVAYAKTLPGDHPVTCSLVIREWVIADPERIAQVLHNLLNNAAKYSPARAPIVLEAKRTGDRVRIAVIDRGAGIHPEDRERIFEKFGRGRDTTGRRITGLGLGLYLTRRILQAHGSDLTMESAPGQGSTFAFELEVAGDPNHVGR